MITELVRIAFPKGKVHLVEHYGLWTLCGIYRMSTLRETLAEVTCKHCLKQGGIKQ